MSGIRPLRSSRGPTPFLKWAGGKRQLLPELRKALPRTFGRYFEPFVGGGALFFDLTADDMLVATPATGPRATLADANELLISAYRAVRDDVEAVIKWLTRYERLHSLDTFLSFRRSLTKVNSRLLPSARAARFIYLNKTCFNGLWRTNKVGQFNVPMDPGSLKGRMICDVEGLRAVSIVLQRVSLVHGDFAYTVIEAKRGDLIYFDPPYIPASASSNFTGYTRDGFTLEDQRRLVVCAYDLKRRGVHVILSNSDTALTAELYRGLGFNLRRVSARRNINSKADRRGSVGEVIIT